MIIQILFSKPRCELLKLIPEKLDEDWLKIFIHQLKGSQTNQPEALLLATYLTNSPEYNDTYFQHILTEYKTPFKVK